jgi:ankyrin repeat protein
MENFKNLFRIRLQKQQTACELFVRNSRVFWTDRRVRFLLAHMHFESLLRLGLGTKAKVVFALENLSKGSGALEAAYSEAILRIDGQPQGNRILAKNALSWISYAQRPLTTGELCHALAVQPGDTQLDPDNIPDIDDIISVCAGLVTIDKEGQIVRLVHYTTQQYLVSIREKWHHDAQYHIASTCLSYLCFDAFASGSCTSDVEFERRLQQHEFLYYSTRYWEQHVAAVQNKISSLAMVLLHNSNLIACATQTRSTASKKHEWVRMSQVFPKRVTGLHLTVSFGLLHLSEQLLFSAQGEKLTLAEARDSYGQTPLMWAARNGQLETVMLLLSIDDVDPDAKDHEGMTPLMWAALNGHNDIVKQLLLNTSNVNPYAKDENGRTLLTWAVWGGRRDTVEMLLALCNFDLSETCNEGGTLFDHAVEGGKNGTVDLLLGLNKIKTCDYCRGLELAAFGGHEDTIMLLLNTDKFDPNARDTTGETPLSWSVRNDCRDAVELLLSTDRVDPDARDATGKTPLMLAVHKECEDIVELLLSTGKVDLNATAKGDDRITPLMFAVYLGHEGIVKLLLSTGKVDLNTNAKVDDRMMPLMCAVYLGHEGIVKLLLRTDKAHPHVKINGIPTMLKMAEEKGHKAIVKLLESYSCDF